MTYDQWFRSQQGTPYEGAYLFAEAAWEHQQQKISTITRQRDLAVEALEKVGELMLCGKKDQLPGRCYLASKTVIKTLSAIKESEKL